MQGDVREVRERGELVSAVVRQRRGVRAREPPRLESLRVIPQEAVERVGVEDVRGGGDHRPVWLGGTLVEVRC